MGIQAVLQLWCFGIHTRNRVPRRLWKARTICRLLYRIINCSLFSAHAANKSDHFCYNIGYYMRVRRLFNFFIATFTTLALFFGIGAGHSITANQLMHGMSEETTAQCQSICPPLINEKQRTPQVNEDDTDPSPFPFQPIDQDLYIGFIYSVLLSVLALFFLQRRPPDLVLVYNNWRN